MSEQAPYVYGTFRWPMDPRRLAVRRVGEGAPDPDTAILVQREFGPTEMRGKVFWRVGHLWNPIPLEKVRTLDWFIAHQKKAKGFLFDMQYSNPWEVLFFRAESDESNLYLSVGLKLMPDVPSWLQLFHR
jgi:hypothetical protein